MEYTPLLAHMGTEMLKTVYAYKLIHPLYLDLGVVSQGMGSGQA